MKKQQFLHRHRVKSGRQITKIKFKFKGITLDKNNTVINLKSSVNNIAITENSTNFAREKPLEEGWVWEFQNTWITEDTIVNEFKIIFYTWKPGVREEDINKFDILGDLKVIEHLPQETQHTIATEITNRNPLNVKFKDLFIYDGDCYTLTAEFVPKNP